MLRSRSFRDPAGQLIRYGGRLFRVVHAAGAANFKAFQSSAVIRQLSAARRIVSTTVLDEVTASALAAELGVPAGAAIVEHERIAFPSYPYEWAPAMLAAAANLTLELAEALLEEGLGLKDASPFNILFRGAEPVFVDILSVEPRDLGDPIWRPCAQFIRTFLLPLLAYKHFGLRPDQIFTVQREGLYPEDMYRICSRVRRLLPPFLNLVTLPTWLASKGDRPNLYRPRRTSPEKASFVVRSLLRRLRQAVKAAESTRGSHWSDYGSRPPSYDTEQLAVKREFVEQVIQEFRPKRVLDLGCNTGEYSILAARGGAQVVAVDTDVAVVDQLFHRTRAERVDVQPIRMNIANPSAGTGWLNHECLPFLDRARNARFDAALMLAMVHHLLVTERLSLEQIVDFVAELGINLLVIEFIGPHDRMFRQIVRGRDELYAGLTSGHFEEEARRRFDVVRSCLLPGLDRRLYLLRRIS
jgi:SAM-dependent methyltransferase